MEFLRGRQTEPLFNLFGCLQRQEYIKIMELMEEQIH
jgi:hypothetical protein